MKFASCFLIPLLLLSLVPNCVEANTSKQSCITQRSSSLVSKEKRKSIPFSRAIVTKNMPKDVNVVAQGAAVEGSLLQLLLGAGGIYAAYMYYGVLQEDVMGYTAADGTKFHSTWFIQVLEALANVVVGGIGRQLAGGGTSGLNLQLLGYGGIAQVSAKAFTMSALANGLSFPVVTLAKSGKMVPVMIGSILMGGKKYTMKQYISVLAIIAGTCIVSSGKKKGGGSDSLVGLMFIIGSLCMDGLAGGAQERLKKDSKVTGKYPTAWDNMFWTNTFMALTALVIAGLFGELATGYKFCTENPEIFKMIGKFCACSAFGQTFIFFVIANFDSLTCTTVTTTRKVFSVLLSIFLKGHSLSTVGWGGLGLASAGILSELQDKYMAGKKKPDEQKKKK